MNHPKFIVSYQMEVSIRLQRVNGINDNDKKNVDMLFCVILCLPISLWSYHYGNLGLVTYFSVKVTFSSCSISSLNHI